MDFGIFDHMDFSGTGSLSQFYEDRLELAELYDEIGIYAYHLAEHHATPLGMAPSPNLILSAIAQRTSKLRFGPLVYCLPLYHPIRLLEEICMLDQLSGGRLEMGIGRGISPIELSYWGVSYEEGPAKYRDTFELITKGLVSETLSHESENFRVNNMPLHLSAVQKPHPPLWYGIANPESIKWPADNQLNIITNQTVEITKKIVSAYKQTWSKLGSPLAKLPRLGMTRYVVIANETKSAVESARRAYPVWRKSFMSLWDMHGQKPIGITYPETFDELMKTGQGIAGTPDEVLNEIISQCVETDINYFVGRFSFGDLTLGESQRSIELFADQVMPELHNLG